jgi:hypothetical protein
MLFLARRWLKTRWSVSPDPSVHPSTSLGYIRFPPKANRMGSNSTSATDSLSASMEIIHSVIYLTLKDAARITGATISKGSGASQLIGE